MPWKRQSHEEFLSLNKAQRAPWAKRHPAKFIAHLKLVLTYENSLSKRRKEDPNV
jgi:hypothetical protein